jgi:hypothetical protein
MAQGWADPEDYIKDKVSNTRDCNADAQFKHVLTMTGQSDDMSDPTFSYDSSGRDCLDTIQDFIATNNPEGLSAIEWKNKYWAKELGMENHR